MIDLLNRIGFRQIAFGGEGGGGGGAAASGNSTKTRWQKQPHLLAYITPAEAALLNKNGGTGEMVNGIPAFRPVKGRTQVENRPQALVFLVAAAAVAAAVAVAQTQVI
jgi:hypothetical protein